MAIDYSALSAMSEQDALAYLRNSGLFNTLQTTTNPYYGYSGEEAIGADRYGSSQWGMPVDQIYTGMTGNGQIGDAYMETPTYSGYTAQISPVGADNYYYAGTYDDAGALTDIQRLERDTGGWLGENIDWLAPALIGSMAFAGAGGFEGLLGGTQAGAPISASVGMTPAEIAAAGGGGAAIPGGAAATYGLDPLMTMSGAAGSSAPIVGSLGAAPIVESIGMGPAQIAASGGGSLVNSLIPGVSNGQLFGAGVSALGNYLGNRALSSGVDEAARINQQNLDKILALQQPWITAGTGAVNRLATGLAPGGEFATPFTQTDWQQDPGYQFRLSEGLKALDRQMASRGSLLSGGALKGTQRYAQDLASQEYQNAFNRYYNERTNMLAPVQSLAGLGQTNIGQATNAMSAAGTNAGNAALTGSALQASQYGALGNTIGNIFNPSSRQYA